MKTLLGFVFGFFMAVLIICYWIAREANPIFVDQQGRPTNVAKTGY